MTRTCLPGSPRISRAALQGHRFRCRASRDQVLIENAGPGMNLLQDLRAAMPRGMTRPIGVKPKGGKVDRMAAQSAKIEQHETGKPLHIKGLLRILIPPFPGSNPGAPASQNPMKNTGFCAPRTQSRIMKSK